MGQSKTPVVLSFSSIEKRRESMQSVDMRSQEPMAAVQPVKNCRSCGFFVQEKAGKIVRKNNAYVFRCFACLNRAEAMNKTLKKRIVGALA